MRKWMLVTGIAGVLALAFSSCATSRDCNGVKHTTLSNGVRI